MNFTPQTILDLTKGFSMLFEKAYNAEAVPIIWDRKAERVDTPGTEINVYGWLAEMPMFRKWFGARIAKRLAARVHQIKNEPYEFSYSIGRDDIKYDRFGIYNGHASRAGIAARLWLDQMLHELVKIAGSTKCFDGQFFYDTDHPQIPEDPSSPVFANLFPNRLPTPANIAFGCDTMAQIKDANGELMHAVPDTIEFGYGLRDQVMNSLNADLIAQIIRNQANSDNVAAAAVSNNLKAGGLPLTPVLNDRLSSSEWYLHHTRIMKPFIVQVETAPTGLQSRVNAEDPHVWDNNEFLFGSIAYGGAGFGLPHLSAKFTT